MKILVCVKQVPSSNKVELDPVTKNIIRDGRQSVINPWDESALELAILLKERYGGEITVLSMGIPDTDKLLREAIYRGADRAILLTDRAFAGADTLATSYALSLGIRQAGPFDLILCGKMAIDGDTAQIGPELAQQLGLPYMCDVTEIVSIKQNELLCKANVDDGWRLAAVSFPALLTIGKADIIPRMPTLARIRANYNCAVQIETAASLSAELARCGMDGSPTQVINTFVPERSQTTVELTGNETEQAVAILAAIKEAI